MGSQEFVLLPADEIAKLLASDDLNVSNEEIMFQVSFQILLMIKKFGVNWNS